MANTTNFAIFVIIFTSMILTFLYYLYFDGYNNGALSRKKLVKLVVATAFFGILIAGELIFAVTYYMS